MDAQGVRRTARRITLRAGTFVCAAGGTDGLEAATRENPDLILLDVDMPDLSGFDVCRILKADVRLGMTPIIFLSGSDNRESKVRGLDLGAVDYVTKPFDSYELQARVRAALRTKRLQDLLTKYAKIDLLTELGNRRALEERLRQEWSRALRLGSVLAVVMSDIDHFKSVNDTYGHPVGDRLLGEIAKAMARQCRESDFPARYGGEEFAIVCPHTDAEGAYLLAQRYRRGVEGIRLNIQGKQVRVTMSFGVADSQRAPSWEVLLQLADQALYRAKREGRNRVIRADAATPAVPG
jgi:diguanylate cyclase (GGDEF)-like protein